MKMIITDQAIQWFKDEMDLEEGAFIRFFARYGGSNPFHEGYSIGMNTDTPIQATITEDIGGFHFYIENDDEWFFAGHDFKVDVNTDLDELSFTYLD